MWFSENVGNLEAPGYSDCQPATEDQRVFASNSFVECRLLSMNCSTVLFDFRPTSTARDCRLAGSASGIWVHRIFHKQVP